MIVVDASALLELLLRTRRGEAVERTIFADGESALCAPHLIDVEVTQVLRRLVDAGRLTAPRAREALLDLTGMPLARYPHDPLGARMWQLRKNLTAYDAAYVALAESLPAPLVTCDRSMAQAPGNRATIELVEAAL